MYKVQLSSNRKRDPLFRLVIEVFICAAINFRKTLHTFFVVNTSSDYLRQYVRYLHYGLSAMDAFGPFGWRTAPNRFVIVSGAWQVDLARGRLDPS